MARAFPIKADQKLGTAWSLRQHVSGGARMAEGRGWLASSCGRLKFELQILEKSEKIVENLENLRKA